MTNVRNFVSLCVTMPGGKDSCGGGGADTGGAGMFSFTEGAYLNGIVIIVRQGGTSGEQKVDVVGPTGTLIGTVTFADGEAGPVEFDTEIEDPSTVYLRNPRPKGVISGLVSTRLNDEDAPEPVVSWLSSTQNFETTVGGEYAIVATRSTLVGELIVDALVNVNGMGFAPVNVFFDDGSTEGFLTLTAGALPLSYEAQLQAGAGYTLEAPTTVTGEVTGAISGQVNFVTNGGDPNPFSSFCGAITVERTGGNASAATVQLRLVRSTPAGADIDLGEFSWAEGEDGVKTLDVCLLSGDEQTGTLQLHTPSGVALGSEIIRPLVWIESPFVTWGTLSQTSPYGPDAGGPGVPSYDVYTDLRRYRRIYEGAGWSDQNITVGELTVPVHITELNPELAAPPIVLEGVFEDGSPFANVHWQVPESFAEFVETQWVIQPGPYEIGGGVYPANVNMSIQFVGDAPFVPATWDPATKAANITLTNGNLTASSITGPSGFVSATKSRSGDHAIYYEKRWTSVGNSQSSSYRDTGGYGFTLAYGPFGNPTTIGYSISNSVGDAGPALPDTFNKTIGIAVKVVGTVGKVWFRLDGGAWLSGDPEMGTDPWVTFYTEGVNVTPYSQMDGSYGSGCSITAAFSAFETAAPAGFSPI